MNRGRKKFDKNSDKPKETPEYNVLKQKSPETKQDGVRLNKYIADAGVCSRREADKLIESGKVKVNGKAISELGVRVLSQDRVTLNGKVLKKQKHVYVLLNKPKDFITTLNDPEERRTVMDLVDSACDERIYPVGRLDRNTTGLLLLTNDGELADRLAHPSNQIKKLYEVTLNKPIEEDHFDQIRAGLELEDGPAPVDDLALSDKSGYVLGIQIHIGRNRIVRRIFEHLGYEVERLDRVLYAGLTKKDLPRGKWRYLKETELIRLRGLGKKRK